MIVRLEKEQQSAARHQLLKDVVWAVCNDTLRRLQHEGQTTLAPVEVFLSARQFCDTVLGLSDIEEGIDYEMDDLEDEATGENDAVVVMMLATAQLQARSKQQVGIDFKKIILRIYERWNDHELFFPLLNQFANKEEALWLQGKRFDLLNYELQEIKLSGGGSEDIRQLFEDFVGYSDKMLPETIKELLLFLERYNLDHNHAYDKELLALFEKLGIKSTTIIQPKEYVAVKHVENEIQNVEAGATGVIKEMKKD